MPFNSFQQDAIGAPSTEDILVPAGAGSGKTKTLSERVFNLVNKGEVPPESLLVLTFTNNAAHEMKTRILARFPNDHFAAKRMLSCHVQSFDSFNAYLVRCYASRLGVAPGIQILSSSLYEQKKRLYLDEAFLEACEDPCLKQDLTRLMGELGLKNDDLIKGTVLDLIATSEKLSQQEREKFFDEVSGKFLDASFASELYERCIEEYKNQLRRVLRESYLLDQCRNDLIATDETDIDFEKISKVLNNDAYYSVPLNKISLSSDETQTHDFLDEEFQGLVGLLELDGEQFVSSCKTFVSDHGAEYFQKMYPGVRKKTISDSHYHEPVFKSLKQSRETLNEIIALATQKEQWEKMTRFGYGVALFVTLAKKALAKLQDYEKRHNAYTFSDVTALALTLFTDPKNEDIAENLRERFTYVMVDEYQDTNDAQETFIEGLLKPTKSGSRAHLFCVGDAKQSIYAFRGSNVALFRRRQKVYESKGGVGAKVIPMAVNYRSAKTLLNQINYIFSRYMRADHGGIEYTNPIEMLGYDDEVNLYHEELAGYGIHRIVPPMSHFFSPDAAKFVHYDAVSYEAKAILADIQNKLATGFPIFDRSLKTSRPCRKNDFCILVRRKRSVPVYQRLFAENGIALNNRISVDLRDASAISLIQSLLRLLCFALGEETDDLAHCFASVARSYVFRYDDEKLHQILSAGNRYDLQESKKRILEDPIMTQMKEFAEEYREESFPVIFLALLERFGVIKNLYRIGAVEDNLAKIESLYALALSQGGVGEGLADFVALFRDMDKRQLSLDSESVYETADAVDLMTIHASKGLERKIVYMPSSENGLGKGPNKTGSLAKTIDKDLGLVLPDVGTPYTTPDIDEPILATTLPMRYRGLIEFDEEEQENVRLLYVALTRAENALYLVGQNKEKRSVYIMMKDVPSFVKINPILLQNPNISSKLRHDYEEYVARKLKASRPNVSGLDKQEGKTKEKVIQEHYQAKIDAADEEMLFQILDIILAEYQKKVSAIEGDDDEIAKLFALAFYPSLYAQNSIDGAASLFAALSAKNVDEFDEDEEEETEEDEESEGSGETEAQESFGNYDEFIERLHHFCLGIKDGDLGLLCPALHLAKKKAGDAFFVHKTFVDLALLPLAQHFDRLDYVYRSSYQNESGPIAYPDDTVVFSETSFQGNVTVTAPELKKLSIDDIDLNFVAVGGKRASKTAEDGELPSAEALERGTRLHRYMQLLDFETLDLSFIPETDRPLIEKVLQTPLMQQAIAAQASYPEYDFYDTESLHMGSIDLLFVSNGIYHIVDYKTTHIDDPDYRRQVRVYARNVMRLFGVAKENIRLHLLSLRLCQSIDVPLDESED